MVRVDYNKEHFCHQCSLKVSIDLFRCPDCHQKVRTKRHNKSKSYEKLKVYLNQERQPRSEDFRIRMRRLRVKRIMLGLKPNVPVPETT